MLIANRIMIIVVSVSALTISAGCRPSGNAVNIFSAAGDSEENTIKAKMEKLAESMNWVRLEDEPGSYRSTYRKKGELLIQTSGGIEPNVKKIKSRPLSAKGLLLKYNEEAQSFDEIKQSLLKDKSIVNVEPNIVIKSCGGHGRDAYKAGFSGDYRRLQKDVQKMKNFIRGKRIKAARRIKIGIIDTGIDFEHPDLAGNVKGGVNLIYIRSAEDKAGGGILTDEDMDATEMDYNGHGTKVAGIIGALNNDFGIDGLCEDAEIYGIKAFNGRGYGYLSDIIEGIQWAVDNDIQILNLSFGTYERSAILEEAVNGAVDAGILIIASAGNDYADDVMYPAKFSNVFAVGSHNENGIVSAFSNWGGDIDVYAPGEELLSTDIGGAGYSRLSGTSAACAFVAGMAALALSENCRDVFGTMRDTAVKMESAGNPDSGCFPILNGKACSAILKSERFSELTLTALSSKRVLYRTDETVDIDYTVQNTGLQRSEPCRLKIQFTADGTERNAGDIMIPARAPGGRYSGKYQYKLLPPLPDKTRSITANIFQADKGLSYINKFEEGFSLSVDDEPRSLPRVTTFYVTGADFREDADRFLVMNISNTGSRETGELTIRPFSKWAKEEGLSEAPANILGDDYFAPPLAPGARARMLVPLDNFSAPAEGYLSVFAAVYSSGSYLFTQYKTYRVYGDGSVKINFMTKNHKYIMNQAVELLRKQGIYIPDLHNPSGNYYGPDNPIMETLNMDVDIDGADICTKINKSGYWTGDHYDGYNFTMNYSFINGHRDEDQLDIVYGQCGGTTWDSHFWIVDDNDSEGRAGAHSAFNKIHALLNGGDNLDYGALGHYRAGYKRAAWYFLGRACHLIADMTVPEHVTEENSHGAVGAAYEGWIADDANYDVYGDSESALKNGGTINPYQADNPLRFLVYTAAQVGDSFPWASTMTGTTYGGDGNRTAGGDSPHYDSYMNVLFGWVNELSKKAKPDSAFPDKHPLLAKHLNKWEGEWCLFGKCGDCTWEYVNYAGFDVKDCNGNGHKDYDNTEDGYHNTDGDLAAIAYPSVNYAIKAVAGLIYYFAVQSGQIQHTLGNQSGLTFETPCLMPASVTGGVKLQCCE